jgi:hypothetical protein
MRSALVGLFATLALVTSGCSSDASTETTSLAVVETTAADDCAVVPADVATFELKITDNGVLYNDAPVPACLRASAAQAVSVVNNAEGDANIMLGSQAIELLAGNTAGDVVTTYGEVGESFDVYVAELDTTVIVQVAPGA